MALDWVLGKDKAGTVYLFQPGAAMPNGGTATAKSLGLTQSMVLGPDINSAGVSMILQSNLAKLKATSTQISAIVQAIDSGSIMQGGLFVGVPVSQKPGQTLPGYGQKPSASEAVPAGLSLPDVFGQIWQWLTTPSKWLKILEALGGAVLIYLGIKELVGLPSPMPAIEKVVR